MSTYVLFSAVYATVDDAVGDLRELVGSQRSPSAVAGSSLLRREWDGRATLERAGGGTIAYSAMTGLAIGLAIGPGTPSLWGSALVGAIAGALLGREKRDRENAQLGTLLGGVLPPGACSLVAVVAEEEAPRLDEELDRALRTATFPIDGPGRALLAKSLVRGNPVVTEAIDRQQPPD